MYYFSRNFVAPTLPHCWTGHGGAEAHIAGRPAAGPARAQAGRVLEGPREHLPRPVHRRSRTVQHGGQRVRLEVRLSRERHHYPAMRVFM